MLSEAKLAELTTFPVWYWSIPTAPIIPAITKKTNAYSFPAIFIFDSAVMMTPQKSTVGGDGRLAPAAQIGSISVHTMHYIVAGLSVTALEDPQFPAAFIHMPNPCAFFSSLRGL
jgi:hypothetical protein